MPILTEDHKAYRKEKNFLSSHKGKRISRILPLSRLIDSFQNNTVYFPSISAWDDPYEGFLYRLDFRDIDDTSIDFSRWLENTFGQCWSYAGEYDAAWKIYGKNSDNELDYAVKIEVDLYEYYSHLYDNIKSSELLFYATDVKYEEKNYYVNIADTITYENILNSSGPIYLMENILNIKRKEFAYEEEVRFMYAPTSDSNGYGEHGVTFHVNIKPLVKNIIFPPTMTFPTFGPLRTQLLDTGYTGGIQISTLYDFDLPQLVGKSIKLGI